MGSGKKTDKSDANLAGPTSATTVPQRTPLSSDRGNLAAGSNATVISSNLLIADQGNDRLVEIDPQGRVVWEFPRPGDLDPGQTFRAPSAAFFTSDNRHLLVTSADEAVVHEIDLVTNKIAWSYGRPGNPGVGVGQLSAPGGAQGLPSGQVVIPDSKNCRILIVNRDGSTAREYGKTGTCKHGEGTLGTPVSSLPLANGNLLVTEATGAWVGQLSGEGKLLSPTHPPGVKTPMNALPVFDGTYVVVDSAMPGKVVNYDRAGKQTYGFGDKTGPGSLNKPTIAYVLPSGLIIVADAGNQRIVAIDRQTNKVVWQFGATGKAGRAPGELNNPAGLSVAPPGL